MTQEPPRHIWYELDEALELLAALEDARFALFETASLTVVVAVERRMRLLGRRLDFEDPEGGTNER